MRRGLLLLAIIAPIHAWATPSVTSSNAPDLLNGTTCSVSGTNFTTLSTNVYINDQLVSGSFAGWSQTNDLKVVNDATNARTQYSNFVATSNFVDNRGHGYVTGGTDQPQYFVQYWWKIGNDWDWGDSNFTGLNKFLSNLKFIRLWDSGSDGANIYLQMGEFGLTNDAAYTQEDIGGFGGFITGFTKNSLSKNDWHLIQAEFKDSSSVGVADAEIRVWLDGVRILNVTGFTSRDASNTHFHRPFIVGYFNAWQSYESTPDTTGDDGPNSFYESDMVVQDAFNRLEISTCATYAVSCKREFQPALSWSDTAINFRLTPGILDTSKQLYAYVTDSSGNQSPAYTFSSGGGGGGGGSPDPGLSGKSIKNAQMKGNLKFK